MSLGYILHHPEFTWMHGLLQNAAYIVRFRGPWVKPGSECAYNHWPSISSNNHPTTAIQAIHHTHMLASRAGTCSYQWWIWQAYMHATCTHVYESAPMWISKHVRFAISRFSGSCARGHMSWCACMCNDHPCTWLIVHVTYMPCIAVCAAHVCRIQYPEMNNCDRIRDFSNVHGCVCMCGYASYVPAQLPYSWNTADLVHLGFVMHALYHGCKVTSIRYACMWIDMHASSA